MDERDQVLKDFFSGKWVDTDLIEKYLGITFKEGFKLFDFSRTAEWNPPPLNGQRIETFFRIKNMEVRDGQDT